MSIDQRMKRELLALGRGDTPPLRREGWKWIAPDDTEHLSECQLVEHPHLFCTCRDWSPE